MMVVQHQSCAAQGECRLNLSASSALASVGDWPRYPQRMATSLLWREDVHRAAHLVSLLRLLLLALTLGLWTLMRHRNDESSQLWAHAINQLEWLMLGVLIIATLMLLMVQSVHRSWQLVLHLVFDLIWVGMVIYFTGGVSGPGPVLLFAVVLTSNLLLPSTIPFVMPLVSSLVLAMSVIFYLAGQTPFLAQDLRPNHPIVAPSTMFANLAIQVGALFLVDLLAQALSRRLRERDLLTNELIEHLKDAVLVSDRDGRILYSNGRVAEMLDLPRSPDRGERISMSSAVLKMCRCST